MNIDFGRTADDYSRHRAGFPDSLFKRLFRYDIGRPGQRVVDLGTGTGSLARGFARRHCIVIGIDPAERLLHEARRLDKEAGLQVTYCLGKAEELGLAAHSVDVIAAGQCWHWFDRPQAALSAARVLKPQGQLVIAHFDWLPLAGNVVAATEALILQHNPEWNMAGGNGLYPQWLRDIREAGYRQIESFSYDTDVAYSHEAWRGRIRASAGIAASLSSAAVQTFDRDLQEMLSVEFPHDTLIIPHRIFAVIAVAPAPSSPN